MKRLTKAAALDAQPACRPDGKRVAFHSDRSGNLGIWEMNLNGKKRRNVTSDPAPDVDADYSPNGKQLLFARQRDDNTEIFLLKPVKKPKQVVQLTQSAAPVQNRLPKFTPEGTLALFTRLNADAPNQIVSIGPLAGA